MDFYVCVLPLFLALSMSCSAVQERCPADVSTEVSLSIASRRNLTGHWFISVDAEKAEPAHYSEREVVVDMRHSSASCAATRYTRMSAVYVSPPDVDNNTEHTCTQIPSTVAEQPQYTTGTTSTAAPTVIIPPVGYEHHPGLGYYKFHTEALPWEQSRDKCVQEGAHLIILNSQQEAALAMKLATENQGKLRGAYFSTWFYVGVSDIQQEGQWMTVLGGRLEDTGYVNWSSGPPGGGTAQNCLYVSIHSTVMDDDRCELKAAFICEWRPLQ